MGKTTGIEWTDSTWNPIRGCSRVSEGCRNCYAESVAARFSGPGQAYEGLAEFRVIGEGKPEERTEPHWTGEVRLIESHLRDPLRWKEPRKIFVNSMSDLFYERLTYGQVNRIWNVMRQAEQHTFQVLTKRPKIMLAWMLENCIRPLSNVWLGVSVEDQKTADERIPLLLQTPASVRFISYEPALGPVDLSCVPWPNGWRNENDAVSDGIDPLRFSASHLDWVICGGESGPHARPMSPDWARAVRDQCKRARIPFFFKQWGEWLPYDQVTELAQDCMSEFVKNDAEACPYRFGKNKSGAVLDGVEWKEFPK